MEPGRKPLPIPTLDKALDRIPAAFGRFQEAHFWIHSMESYYHFSSQFRWHPNAFLKALKEVPQLLQMERSARPLRRRSPL